jgi:hypothetical protein
MAIMMRPLGQIELNLHHIQDRPITARICLSLMTKRTSETVDDSNGGFGQICETGGNPMSQFIQALESRRLMSATPSPAMLAAIAKLETDIMKAQSDLTAFHTAVAATNATFLTAKAADLAAMKADLASKDQPQLAADRLKLHDDIAAHTAGLKTDVAGWIATRHADIQALHADVLAIRQARGA